MNINSPLFFSSSPLDRPVAAGTHKYSRSCQQVTAVRFYHSVARQHLISIFLENTFSLPTRYITRHINNYKLIGANPTTRTPLQHLRKVQPRDTLHRSFFRSRLPPGDRIIHGHLSCRLADRVERWPKNHRLVSRPTKSPDTVAGPCVTRCSSENFLWRTVEGVYRREDCPRPRFSLSCPAAVTLRRAGRRKNDGGAAEGAAE